MGSENGASGRAGGLGGDVVAEARQQLSASLGMIRHCLGQLDDEQVWWRPREDMNSIGNLLLHLTGNLRQRIFANIGGEPDVRDRFAEFTERAPIPKEELLRRFEEIVGRADGLVAGLTADRLVETRSYKTFAGMIEGTVHSLLFRTLTHLSGHTQEILHLTRQQLGERYTFRDPAGVPPRAGRPS
jgi:hypothetical protein